MVIRSDRRRLVALAAGSVALGMAGCAVERWEDPPAPASPDVNPVLTPWLSLTGGWRAGRPGGARVSFVQPTGVAARDEVLLVADAGAGTLWRVDRARDVVSPLAPYAGGVPDHGTSMQLGADLAAWIALPAEHRVVQYDFAGRIVRQWRDEADVPRPVAVVVPEHRGEVYIADAATATIVVFDPLGHPLRVLGGRRPASLQSVAAMAAGPLGLYVLDRVAQQVVVLDRAGLPLAVIGEQRLVQPRALAVDRHGRVFVGDDGDQRIKVFRGPDLVASFGGRGNGPARFGRIESLALDGNLLYAADSLNARVQVLMVAPEPAP